MRLLPLLLICACPGVPADTGEGGAGGAGGSGCDEATLYDEGYALGELCVDWITAWTEDDGQCAADALAEGYNDARAVSGEDCDQSPASVGGGQLPDTERE